MLLSLTLTAFALATPAPHAESPGDQVPALRARTDGFLPRGITSFGAAELDGWIFVLGGYFGTPHEYSKAGQSGTFLKISTQDPSDQRLLPDHQPLQSIALVAHGGRLIRVGGMQALNEAGEEARLQSTASVRSFDPISESWSSLPDLPIPLSSHRAVVLGDTLYVTGGWTLFADGSRPAWNPSLWSLDLGAKDSSWQSSPAPFKARAQAATTAGGLLVVTGGISEKGKPVQATHIFDPKAHAWRAGPDYPQWAFGLAAATDGKVALASGRDGRVHAWSPEQQGWQTVAKWNFPRFFHELVPTPDGDLFCLGGIGGMDESGRLRIVERLSAAEDLAPTIQRWTVPSPMHAKNRQGMLLRNSSLYFFGGNNSLGQHDFEEENFLAAGWRLDLGSMEFTPLAPLPGPTQSMQAGFSSDADRGLFVGGFAHNGTDAVTQAQVHSYSFDLDMWTTLEHGLPRSRTQFGLARNGKDRWIFGGLDYDPARGEGQDFQHLTEILQWQEGHPGFAKTGIQLPEPRRAFAGAVHGDEYFLVGGMREDFELVPTTRAFQFEDQTFRTCASPRKTRLSAELLPIGGKLYLVGGSSRNEAGKLKPDPSIEVYDPASDAWTVLLEDVGMSMRHARAFDFQGQILIFSSHQKGGQKAEILLVSVQ